MDPIDTLVVGAGVVGLVCADALARAGREVVVLQADAQYGSGVSSRNSEVIHSGIYYPTGSTKARTCVRGRQLLYAFCEAHGVAHRRCGKRVVATRIERFPRARAGPALRQGQRLRSGRTQSVLAPDLSGAGEGRTGRASDPGSGRTRALRSRRRMDDAPDYDVNLGRLPAFYAAIRRYWPGLGEGRLVPDYAGVRPKIYAPGEPPADFDIAGPAAHGLQSLVCLFGIESPELTAALAVAEDVARALQGSGAGG